MKHPSWKFGLVPVLAAVLMAGPALSDGSYGGTVIVDKGVEKSSIELDKKEPPVTFRFMDWTCFADDNALDNNYQNILDFISQEEEDDAVNEIDRCAKRQVSSGLSNKGKEFFQCYFGLKTIPDAVEITVPVPGTGQKTNCYTSVELNQARLAFIKQAGIKN